MNVKALGELIKQKRAEKEFTLRDLEEVTGISHSQLSKLERGLVKNPEDSTLDKLSYALNIARDELYILSGRLNQEIAQDVAENLPIIFTLKDYLSQFNPPEMYSHEGKIFDEAVKEIAASYSEESLGDVLYSALVTWDRTLTDEQAKTITKDMEAVYRMWIRRFNSSE